MANLFFCEIVTITRPLKKCQNPMFLKGCWAASKNYKLPLTTATQKKEYYLHGRVQWKVLAGTASELNCHAQNLSSTTPLK